METILVNRTGKVRRAIWNGREYLVAPLSSIVADGVLNGSKGSLFYPTDEISRNFSAWDGMPITVYHPTDPLTGEHLSANDTGVLDRQGVGFLHNTTFKGKLRHEGWFDVERTKVVDPRVLNALMTGKPMELSTGLFTDNDLTPGVAPNGRAYSAIARNYRPDHMAILPDQIGACILPGQEVQGRIVKASKAWYTGETVRIRTESGVVLAVTANHPVLTSEGFVSAGQLTEGQDLLHYVGEDESFAGQMDKKNAPALAEEIFESLNRFVGAVDKAVRRRASVLDFHGDAAFFQGDVEIVSAKRQLRSDGIAESAQGFAQGGLRRGSDSQSSLSRGGHAEQFLRLVDPADACAVSSGSEPLALGSSQLGVHQARRFRTPSHDASLFEPAINDARVDDSSFLANRINGFAADVIGNDCVSEFRGEPGLADSLLPAFRVFGSGAELDTPSSELLADSVRVESGRGNDVADGFASEVIADPAINDGVGNLFQAEISCSLFERLLGEFPGKVTADRIACIDRVFYNGPVYDFESTVGYIIAEKLIVSNCSISDGCGVLVNRGLTGNGCDGNCENCQKLAANGGPGSGPHQHVMDAVQQHGQGVNLAKVADVRDHLASVGIKDKAEQDKAIHGARMAGKVTGSGFENFRGVDPAEADRQIKGAHKSPQGEEIGYLSIRNSQRGPTVNRQSLWQELGEMLGVTDNGGPGSGPHTGGALAARAESLSTAAYKNKVAGSYLEKVHQAEVDRLHHNPTGDPARNAAQPRHPTAKTFQGLPHNAAKRGFTDTDMVIVEPKSVDDDDEALNPDDHSPESLIKNDDDEVLAYNRDWPQGKRDALPSGDFAGPNQSFPISTQADVDSACKLYGKAKDPAAVKAKIKAIAAKKGLSLPDSWTENAFNFPTQQVSHMEPQDASKQAAMASMAHEPARAPALQALDAAKSGDGAGAAKAHLAAAKVHDKAATSAFADKEPEEAQDHIQAASLHRAAAGMQQATCNTTTGNTMIANDNPGPYSPGQFAAMDDKAASAHADSSKAFKASAHANKTGTAGAHRAAADAHRTAAASHRDEGNKEMAKGHSDAAKSHTQKANAASKGTTNMNREQVLETLTANCSCDEDRAALNQLSDATLNAMGKMPSFAAASPDPKTAAEVKKKQDEEDGDDPNADDDEDTPSAKGAFTGNARAWMAATPPEYRDVLNAGAESIRRERAGMIQQLTANFTGNELKRRTESLAKKGREQLRELISYLPPVQTRNGRQMEFVEPMFLGAAAPTDGLASNSADDDVLDIPVLNFDDDKRKQA